MYPQQQMQDDQEENPLVEQMGAQGYSPQTAPDNQQAEVESPEEDASGGDMTQQFVQRLTSVPPQVLMAFEQSLEYLTQPKDLNQAAQAGMIVVKFMAKVMPEFLQAFQTVGQQVSGGNQPQEMGMDNPTGNMQMPQPVQQQPQSGIRGMYA